MELFADPSDILAAFARAVGGQPRPAQLRLTAGARHALEEGGLHVVAEAPTGVGKSGVAIAVAGAVPEDHQVVISTRTKALQDQYAGRDLTIFQDLTGRRAVVVKGRQNFLCRAAIAESEATSIDDVNTVRKAADALDAGVAEWSVAGIPKEKAWLVSTTSDECPGVDCEYADRCPAMTASTAAKSAHLVVANHTLLAMAILGRGGTLQRASVVIVDEAHHLPDVVRDTAGSRLTPGKYRAAAKGIAREGGRRTRIPDDFLVTVQDGFLVGAQIEAVTEECFDAVQSLAAAVTTVPAPSKRLKQRLHGLSSDIDALLDAANCDGEIPMASYAVKENGGITVRPTAVAHRIAGWLRPRTSLHLSATLAGGPPVARQTKDRFAPYLADVGLQPDEVLAAVLPSPFPPDAAVAYVPRTGPDPRANKDDRNAWVAEQILRLLELTDGRALLLATSWRGADVMFDAAYDAGRWHVAKQQPGESVAQLIAHFKDDEHSVLVGVDTLREGIDVPGQACSLVVYDKIPNLPPDDPYIRAMCGPSNGTDRYRARYDRVNRPRAALALTQAMGRLVRSPEDRGIVACLDQRLWKQKNRRLLTALRWPTTDSFDRVADFWHQVRPQPELVEATA